MGHNVSQQKAERMRAAERQQELAPYIVPGWRYDTLQGRIVHIPTILGAHQRRQSVLLRCQRADCRRRVEPDLLEAVKAGMGDRAVADIAERLRCRHWSGCALVEVSTTYPHGVPLVAYLVHDDVLIAVACAHCQVRALLPPRKIIDRLKAAGLGDGSTGVLELGRVVRGPCRKCHRRQFTTEVVWPSGPWSTTKKPPL